jgi:hypothetical protein
LGKSGIGRLRTGEGSFEEKEIRSSFVENAIGNSLVACEKHFQRKLFISFVLSVALLFFFWDERLLYKGSFVSDGMKQGFILADGMLYKYKLTIRPELFLEFDPQETNGA